MEKASQHKLITHDMSPFLALALPPSLTLDEEAIKSAYDASAQEQIHLQARTTLLNPLSRLEAWMHAHDIPHQRHASIPEELLSLFSDLSESIMQVQQLSNKRKQAQSLLSQTLLDKQLFQQKPTLDTLAQKLEKLARSLHESLPMIEEEKDPNLANQAVQCLKFAQKWEAELNKSYNLLLGSL